MTSYYFPSMIATLQNFFSIIYDACAFLYTGLASPFKEYINVVLTQGPSFIREWDWLREGLQSLIHGAFGDVTMFEFLIGMVLSYGVVITIAKYLIPIW